jgi:hypothetical protein
MVGFSRGMRGGIAKIFFCGLMLVASYAWAGTGDLTVGGNLTVGGTTTAGTGGLMFSDGTGPQLSAAVKAGSVAPNGYTILANGLIMQWGTVTSVPSNSDAITFPIAFPHAVFQVQTTYNPVSASSAYIPRARNVTTTGFTFSSDNFNGGLNPSTIKYWFATGY